ncbi:MAG: AarF/ABC1/UbiB kinase family protein [Gammaproteobacteria bacterium]|nr:MAG: AarF/ABC1/UbiB kinase family protein [Gammaproteobacteria bacterium]
MRGRLGDRDSQGRSLYPLPATVAIHRCPGGRHGGWPVTDRIKRLKTGAGERRWKLATTGFKTGARVATQLSTDWLLPKAAREARRKQMLSREAQALADALGELKGSLVKIGQMMAVYGEHVLPPEVTAALHTLEHQTRPMAWPVMEAALREALGDERVDTLVVDPVPVGAASLAQVHRATLADGREVALKIQYPGIADAIDSDLDEMARLIRWSGLVSGRDDFGPWLDSLRDLLHREVNYTLEAATTERFRERLQDDPRFVVPTVVKEYSTPRVLCASFEKGFGVQDPKVQQLSQPRRNRLGKAFLELFLREVFEWGELQTDPNFGNYRIRIGRHADEDQLVLLDFGAAKPYPEDYLNALQNMMVGAYERDLGRVREGAIALGMIGGDLPESVQSDFTEVCAAVIEPLCPQHFGLPPGVLNKQGEYRWRESRLPRRLSKQAAKAALSVHFHVPPGDFVFLSRKLVGVYTFIATLGAEFTGGELLERYAYD